MSHDLSVPGDNTVAAIRDGRSVGLPAIVAAGGDRAMRRYLEFFAVTIENPNTRASLLPCLPAVLRLVRAQRPR